MAIEAYLIEQLIAAIKNLAEAQKAVQALEQHQQGLMDSLGTADMSASVQKTETDMSTEDKVAKTLVSIFEAVQSQVSEQIKREAIAPFSETIAAEHIKPLERAKQFASELAQYGDVDRDLIRDFYARQAQIGRRESEARAMAQQEGGLLPGVYTQFLHDTTSSVIDVAKEGKRYIDRQAKIHLNYRLHGE